MTNLINALEILFAETDLDSNISETEIDTMFDTFEADNNEKPCLDFSTDDFESCFNSILAN